MVVFTNQHTRNLYDEKRRAICLNIKKVKNKKL